MRGLPTKLPATFRTTTALQLWLHPRDEYALRDAGVLTQLSYGVFRRNDAPPAMYPELLVIKLRAPRAIVCCLSAAALHGLIDVPPAELEYADALGAQESMRAALDAAASSGNRGTQGSESRE